MEVKAIVTDIDGTLTDEHRKIVLEAAAAIRKVEEKGIPVILASGNVLPVTWGYSKALGSTGPLVTENGGLVFYDMQIYKLADRKACDDAVIHLNEDKGLGLEYLLTDRWRETEVAVKSSIPVEKVKAHLVDRNLKVEDTGYAIHIMEPHMGKFEGAKKALELLDISVDEVAAFGDSENDLDMLVGCGVGICPANSLDIIKNAADHVCERSYGHGFVEGLKWLEIL